MQRPIPYLFAQHSRIDSPQAPAYDKSRQVKTWFDPKPASDPITYYFLGNGGVRMAMKPMPASEASTLNLPGHPDYPLYMPPPSLATFNGGPFPFGLSTRVDAERIAKELGADPSGIVDVVAGFAGTFPVFYPAGDDRRAFSIVLKNGVSVNVANLVKAQYAGGIGAPGHWDISNSMPAWVSDLAADPDPANPMPVPVGPFADNERVVGVGPLGGTPVLDSPDPVSPATAAAQESDAALATLNDNNRMLKLICGMLNLK